MIVLAFYDCCAFLLYACLLNCAIPQLAFAYIDPSVMTYTIQACAGVAVTLSAVFGLVLRKGRKALARLLAIDASARLEHEPDVHRTGAVSELSYGAAAYPLSRAKNNSSCSCAEVPKKSVERISALKPVLPVRFKTRLAFASVVVFFFVFSLLFARPAEILYAAQNSLVYGLPELWWVLALADLLLFALLSLVLASFRERVFSFLLACIFALSLASYIQALLLNAQLPAADGATIYWGDYMSQQIVSSVVWLVILLLCVCYSMHNQRRFWGVSALISSILVFVQAISLVYVLALEPLLNADITSNDIACSESSVKNPNDASGVSSDDISAAAEGGGKAVVSEDGLYDLSSQNNVIVFVLDTFDDAYLNTIMRQDSHLLDEFTGFTYYKNCTGSMIPTRFAVPALLTGELPSFDESFSTYVNTRYSRSDFLSSIKEAGYSIGIYSDSLSISNLDESEQNRIAALTTNIHAISRDAINFVPALTSLYQMALYCCSPWSLKWAFWYYTDEINSSMLEYTEGDAPEDTVYAMDDLRFYERLRSFGLSVNDQDTYATNYSSYESLDVDDAKKTEAVETLESKEAIEAFTVDERAELSVSTEASEAAESSELTGAFRFIHLLASHYPFNYDENLNYLGEDQSDVFQQSRGALAIVSEYLRQLKQLGLYDQSTIIVTADHGYWTITQDELDRASTPIMFVKPAQSTQEASEPCAISDKPVSQIDLQATILDAMGLDYSSYTQRGEYSAYSMFGDIDSNRIRYYLTTDSEPDLTETQFREYAIVGNAQDFSNWSETGRVIDAQS